jgi:hypothetical protein
MSSRCVVSPLALDPGHYFVRTETPVLPKAVTWYSLRGSRPRAPIDPRHGYLQQVGYFVDSQKMAFVSSSRCGRGVCGIVRGSG